MQKSEYKTPVRKFSSAARGSLEKMGYIIYHIEGKALETIHNETQEPILEEHQLQQFIEGEWVLKDTPGQFWDLLSIATEVAINPDRLVLPNSADKSFKYHQQMVEEFSRAISMFVDGVEAIIGEAPSYIELALVHRKATGKQFFKTNDRFFYVATKTVYGYENGEEILVEVGENEKGLRCYEYSTSAVRMGKRDVWIMPLIIPKEVTTT